MKLTQGFLNFRSLLAQTVEMIAIPFLTQLDSRAAIKGSRDPLGFQPMWSRLGRLVVGNLTTVSTSPRDFTTTILGYYFAERIAAAEGGDGDLNIFLRWEQLAAHARFRVNGDGRLRGIERVRKCANEGDAITLCADARGQILSNQKTYGLWGLYTGPARASGLVEGSPTRLTAAGRKLVESLYLPLFTRSKLRDANEVVSKLTKPLTVLQAAGKDSLFLERVGAVLVPELSAAERATFRHHLLLGAEPNRTEGRQEIVVDALEETIADEEWGFAAPRLRHMAKRCRASGAVGSEAARRLERIRAAEQVLAPAAALFDLILGADGQADRRRRGIVCGQARPDSTARGLRPSVNAAGVSRPC